MRNKLDNKYPHLYMYIMFWNGNLIIECIKKVVWNKNKMLVSSYIIFIHVNKWKLQNIFINLYHKPKISIYNLSKLKDLINLIVFIYLYSI